MGKLLKSISKVCLKKKEKKLRICYLFYKKLILARALIGNWQYFVMGYHENIWFPNAGKILTVYIILKEFREISLAHMLV